MSNLPGTSTMRMLPLHGAIGSCQMWQRALAKTLRTQCADLAAKSNILATYRSVRYRLMRRMSVAMQRRRASVNILEKKAVDGTSIKNAGPARLPVATHHHRRTLVPNRIGTCHQPLMMPSAINWANLHSQRSFATVADQQDTAVSTMQGQHPKQRPLVPVLHFTEHPIDQVEDVEIEINGETSTLNRVPKSPKRRRMVPILHFLENEAKLDRSPTKPEKTDKNEPTAKNTPLVSTNHSVTRKKSFAFARNRPSLMRIRYEMQPSTNNKFNAKNNNYDLKRSSTLQYMMSKYPLMHKLRSPSLPYLQSTNGMEQGLETFETRLRAIRSAQPLNLRVPSLADSDNLNVTQQYRCNRKSRYALLHEDTALLHFSKKFGLMQNVRPTTMALPSIKAHKMLLPQRKIRNMHTMKPRQQRQATKMPKPKQMQQAKNVIDEKRPERDDLSHLLGDLLDKEKKAPRVSIEFNKTAPLFKLVSTSMEGRSNLHRKTFNKQLETPQLFRHPTIKNQIQSPHGKRRGAFLGQSAAFRAKTLLENKLSHLLKVGRQRDEDDDDDDEEDEIDDDHEH